MIQIQDVQKSYRRGGEKVIACDVGRLSVGRGEQVALIGRSGCGKSTLLNMIAGMLQPDTGSIRVVDVEVPFLSESARDSFRAEHIGMVFQTFNLLQPFSALENVMLGSVFSRGNRSRLRERATELLERVGLGERLEHKPNELSVGQAQRVAICRALINEPSLILADEPLGNQDKETGREVLGILLELARASDCTVIMVTHNPDDAALLDRSVDMRDLRRDS
jgi:ABC-type lipoprotein export system ATPase subunit